jgi:hypothetical protein
VQDERACDRLLPKCEACLEKGVVCGGYVVDLNWNERAVAVTEVKSGSQKREANSGAEMIEDSKNDVKVDLLPILKGKEIKFRVGKPRRKRKLKDHMSDESKKESRVVVPKGGSPCGSNQGNELIYVGESPLWRDNSPATTTAFNSQSSTPSSTSSASSTLPCGIAYASVAQKMSGVLEMCKFSIQSLYKCSH